MKKIKASKKDIFLWTGILLLQLIFCNASILNMFPFGYSFAFSLVFSGFNTIIIAIFYFLCSILQGFTFVNLVCTLLVCALVILLGLIKLTTKKRYLYFLLLCCAFSQVANIYFSFTNVTSVLMSLASLSLGLGFCYITYKILLALSMRGVQCFNSTEKTFVCVVLTIMFVGLSGLGFYYIDFSKFLFTLIILACSVALKQKTMFVSCFISIGVLLAGYPVYAINYFVFACACVWLTPKSRFLSASMVCLIDSVFGLFLEYNILSLLPCLIASLVFVAIPSKWLKMLGEYVGGTNKSLISAYYIQKKQELLKSKLDNISNMFAEMQKCYRSLVSPDNADNKVFDLLASELKSNMCESCINKINCYTNKDMSPCFSELISRACKKGKVNFLDVPNLLSSNCNRISVCLSNINQMADEYADKTNKVKEADESKLNVSLQLGGTSKIFKGLSADFDAKERINPKKSAQILNQILSFGMVCRECVVTENEQGVAEIVVIVRSADAVNPQLIKACEKVYPIKFERKICYQTKVAGWSLVGFVPLSRYELVCGYATTPKKAGDKCGDNYVYTKLTDSKYLVAICDGMGHGEEAGNVSAVAISLIESFYKCGLSSQIVIDSVNNLLLPSGGTFTTLDASIVDTATGLVDFIKIGSTISVIKGIDQSQIVGVESLPLGVIQGVVPTTCTKLMYAGDVAVIASDGIVDVFASEEEFCNFINNENIINMQLFAENILEEAQSRSQVIKDDMTVIAYRLVQKR